MALERKSIHDRELHKFVESPSRPTEPAVDVYVSGGQISVVDTDTTAAISVVSAVTSGTEYSFALPANCKKFILKARKVCKIKFSYTAGGTSGNYLSIPRGGFFVDNNFYSAQSIFFATDQNNIDLEIVTYT